MAEFKISRFRYTWQGEWIGDSTTYNRDDVVYYSGSAWVCIRQHTPSIFDNDQRYTPAGETNPSPAWVKMVDGREWMGGWTVDTSYVAGVIVSNGGNLYICVDSHLSSSDFNNDVLKWEVFAVGSNFRNTWTPLAKYNVNDIVRFNGHTYQCTFAHTASTENEGPYAGNNDGDVDSTAETWKTLIDTYSYVGEYLPNRLYSKNDLVKYGGSILKCTLDHISSNNINQIDNSKFETYLSGFRTRDSWNSGEFYAIGDIVKVGGTLYVATENNQAVPPGVTETFPEGTPIWTRILKGSRFRGVWDVTTLYKEGDVVRRGGSLWTHLRDQLFGDDSTLSALDTSNWELVIGGQNFRGGWRSNLDYNLYDTVYLRGVLYYCTIPHSSTYQNFPGDNGSGFSYWEIIVVGDENSGLAELGDLLTYDLYKNVLHDNGNTFVYGDGSSFGATNIPIGDEDQLLVVENNSGALGYKTWGNIQRVFFVRTNGIDIVGDPVDNPAEVNRGYNYFKPWKTIRFALEQADDDYEGFTTILVSTGRYEEVLPLILPARTAVVGEELRAVHVVAGSPVDALANDASYTITVLNRIGNILSDIIVGNAVTVSTNNTVDQNINSTASSTEGALAESIWTTVVSTIDAIVNDIGSIPTLTGSNTATTDINVLAAIQGLENNREFIKAEAMAYIAEVSPSYTFNQELCLRDIDRFIDALQYDLTYPGNYKSVLAGRYYSNAVIGSSLEDMWYVRDSSGLRNMTFEGLAGTVPALEEGDYYSIPTGGAYVSLDPGWGPDDERVWITNRSCYVQNVTTFGYGAIGQKVDGSLHNGGNKSIVSNDFTQVISDGIGAWVTNGGRVELVSVFTYYSHIGMFAQNGGIIRSTNGNSSYGDFGALADGLDASEIVKHGYVNTQTEQAIVASAFAGEILDYILALEYTNMGQNYTTASYSITSSGVGAVAVQEEFRDNGMFECQTLSAGGGFTQYGNQAQSGTPYVITLAAAETATQADILGMRIIIISGEGTGQYGYVQAYNEGTKALTVYRESDDQPGWDHIVPGTPSKDLLTTGTRYRIEPRPTFSSPEYSANVISLDNTYTFIAGAYGETNLTFTGVLGTLGSGNVVPDDGLVPLPAEFTITKTNTSYVVSLFDGGAGYNVDDVIIIDGGVIGGTSGTNDVTITVTSTTEDSTNSILTFTYSGTTLTDAGKFVLTPASSDIGLYSINGETWSEFTLPSSGEWSSLAFGNNKFVSIKRGSASGAYSTNGSTWQSTSPLPASRDWRGLAYGKPSGVSTGVFVAVAGNLNAGAYSTDGITWASTTLPTAGDSTLCEWTDIAFGAGKFVALANDQNLVAVGTWNGTTISWSAAIMDVITDSSRKQWVGITYGNRRFVAFSDTGEVSYSFNGTDWYPASMPTQDGSTLHNWKQIKYGQGVFFAVGDTGGRVVGDDVTTGPTTFAATSYDGIVWTPVELASSQNWGVAVFGNPDVTYDDSTYINHKPTWILASSAASNILNKVYTGAKALGRVVLSGQGISQIKLWESGSGYIALPTLSVTCPGKYEEPTFRTRIADSVLAQPTFVAQGTSYKTSTTYVTVSGDGFADITPNSKYLTLSRLTKVPDPGAQFYIGGRSDYFVAVAIVEKIEFNDGTYQIKFQVSPRPDLNDFLENDMEVVIREKYSQVRITGHDFLDVGTGNAEETNYPLLYENYDYVGVPYQEVYNLNGGRVFYTSTDQSGNFRAGDLFAVEQATGIVTISADFFDLQGLTELRLAGVTVGSTAVIREFSKDPLFLQNSNNIIPTQRAIRSYLQSRLNIGGEDLLTPSVTAGTVKIGPNEISSTVNLTIDIPVLADFRGAGTGVSGSILAQTMFARSFNNSSR